MQVLNNKEVVIDNTDELKLVLEGDNTYEYIYFNNNITLVEHININKEIVILDGTYNNNTYTLHGITSTELDDTISATEITKKVVVKNMTIINANTYGVIYAPSNSLYNKLVVEYNNITFNGTQLSFNPYGTTRIIDSIITIEATEGINSEEVCQSSIVEIGGMTIISSSSTTSLFVFLNTPRSTITFLSNSRVNISSDTMAFMHGTNKLKFTIMPDTEVNLITGNGFSPYTTHGAKDVLIDERSSLLFIEKSHQRIPMWVIFGNLTINASATFNVINTYDSTPSDNYNIHFKGTNQSILFNNPKSMILYSKNANVLYTENPINFIFNISRINMWNTSLELSQAGNIDNLPDYYWYKDSNFLYINGTFEKNSTTVKYNNITSEEFANISSIDDFILNNKKMLSIGTSYININPITRASSTIEGYTLNNSDVLIEYDGNSVYAVANQDGLFSYNLINTINETTKVKITSNLSGSFIYKTRIVEVPFLGEITLIRPENDNITYLLEPILYDPIILPRKREISLTVFDSRVSSSNWKLYVHISSPLTSKLGDVLLNAVVFKKLDDVEIKLNEVPTLIYTGEDNGGSTKVTNITYSTDKGILLNLENNYLKVNEVYNTKIIWSISE